MLKQDNRFLAVLLALVLAVSTLGTVPARAESLQDPVGKAADWIAATWRSHPEAFPTANEIADGILALSAAEQHPDVVRAMLQKLHAVAPAYVRASDSSTSAAALAKVLITLDAANQDTHHFLGADRDLVEELRTSVKQNPPRAVWSPYLISLALLRTGEKVPDFLIQAMVVNQMGGAFGAVRDGVFRADPDLTAMGIMAMQALYTESHDPQTRATTLGSLDAAIHWADVPANQRLDADGNHYWDGPSPAGSTGLLAAALAEADEDTESPVAYLVAQQAKTGVGAWSNVHDGTKPDVGATTHAVLGLVGAGYGTLHSAQLPPLDLNHVDEPAPAPGPGPAPKPAPEPQPAPKPAPETTPKPTPRAALTATAAAERPVGVLANTWGRVDTRTPVAVWTEVRLADGRWSRSQQRHTDAAGRFVIPLTYGATTAGTNEWRVGAAHADGTRQYSAPFTQRRVVTVESRSAGVKPVGQPTNTWGTAHGARNATVWTEVRLADGRWSTSQVRRTDAAGRFVIPLTYGATVRGTTEWRVAVRVDGTVVRSAAFSLVRR